MIRKILALLFCGTFTAFSLFAGAAEQVQQLTLENGLTVFLLDNPSDALVNIKFVCRAGFSSQTQETNGFFKLYTRLTAAENPQINFSSISCDSDSSSYEVNTSPLLLEKTLRNMAEAFFNPNFSTRSTASGPCTANNE